MPQISLVGSGHGGSEDYASIVLWWTAESAIDYGAGNPIKAVCSGNVGLQSTFTMSGTTVNGYSITAKTGEEFDGTNELLCPQSGGLRVDSSDGIISGIAFTGSASGVGLSQRGQDTVVEFCFITHSGTGDAANQNSTNTNKIMRNCVIKGAGNYTFVANSNTFLNQVENCTVIGSSLYGILSSNASVSIINNFSLGHATLDINKNTGVWVSNATEDTSGNAGLTGFTSSELVDFAGGDYRTKSTSTLATAGTGSQSFIGAFLETSSGISLTPSTINSSSVTLNPAIQYSSLLQLIPATINSSSISLESVIQFSSILTIEPNTANSSSISLNPTILFSGSLNIAPATIDSLSIALSSSIQFGASINLSPNTINSLSVALSPVIEYTSALVVAPQTINSSSIAINPSIEFKSLISLIPLTGNSLSITLSPGLNYGKVQTIGTVTAGFADDKYSVKYKLSGITVNFKE